MLDPPWYALSGLEIQPCPASSTLKLVKRDAALVHLALHSEIIPTLAPRGATIAEDEAEEGLGVAIGQKDEGKISGPCNGTVIYEGNFFTTKSISTTA